MRKKTCYNHDAYLWQNKLAKYYWDIKKKGVYGYDYYVLSHLPKDEVVKLRDKHRR